MTVDTRPRQWVGAALLLGWCAVLAVLLPRWAEASTPSTATELTAGERVSAGGVSLLPPEGWSQSTEVAGLLVLTKQDATLDFFPVGPATGSLDETLAAQADAFKADASTRYDIGDPEAFTTDSGLDGAQLVVLSPGTVNVWYAVSDGPSQATALYSSTDNDWKSLHDEVTEMVKSAEFTDDAAASATASAS